VKIRLALAVLLTALLAGCGGGGEESTPAAGGQKLFTDNCANCHTLAAAAAKGQVGPNLDQLRPGADLVKTQVVSGGGGMPAFGGELTGEQIQQIADYVAENAGKS
jgi:mono/diheme cytochrome c family protein